MTYEEEILKAREEKNAYFKNSPQAPLNEIDKVRFKGLNYFSVNKDFRFAVELSLLFLTAVLFFLCLP